MLSFRAFPFFYNGCKRFFSLSQHGIFFVWRVWFCYCPCCLDRVRDLWFFWRVGFEGLGFMCVIYDIYGIYDIFGIHDIYVVYDIYIYNIYI